MSRWEGPWLVWLAIVSGAGHAFANPDAAALGRALGDAPGASVPASLLNPTTGRLPLLVELDPALDPRALGLVPVVRGFAVGAVSPTDVGALEAPVGASYSWAPPRRLLLDQAIRWTRAEVFPEDTPRSGAGTVVGLVDSGIEVRHPDLRDADGHTRVAWLLDFSRSAVGLHPELEAEYGCTDSAVRCAIWSASDIDLALAGATGLAEPRDPFGHGTHVASLAAGNGRSDDPPRFVGMAPEAKLIAVRATRQDGGSVLDADVLLGVRFIFDRAAELGLPAVVNLSLGSDFGAHDGSSLLERGLAEFVGPAQPGRALVIAAGNSGAEHRDTGSGYPEPLGIHTEVHVPPDTSVRVPLLSPPTGRASTRASVFVWLGTRPGDELAVGFERDGAPFLPLVGVGQARSRADGTLTVTVLNRVREFAGMPVGEQGAVVVVDGSWASGAVFALRLEGHGTAHLWVQSEGDLAPEGASLGAVFARASRQGTITVPATHSSLIAVGATLDRTAWTDRDGDRIELLHYGSLLNPVADSVAYFSSAGPTAAGVIKPDLVAPGAFVVGSLARSADPITNGGVGVFAQSSVCAASSYCLVVDDHHGALAGTSMAAPLVSGALALLLAEEPRLSQPELSSLLQAGVRRPSGTAGVEQQIGVGALDLARSLTALRRQQRGGAEVLPEAATSWLTLADAYAHPDPNWPMLATLSLRSASGEIADGFASGRLVIGASVGTVAPPLTREAPGLWRFGLACPAHSGGQTLRVRVLFDGQLLLERSLPIAVDRAVAAGGFVARGGCAIDPGRAGHHESWLLAFVLGLAALAAAWRPR